jgi:hypothetical protein
MEGVPEHARAGWWAGNGGSMSFVDLDARMSIGYVPNRWIAGRFETDRARNVIRAAYQSLSVAASAGRNAQPSLAEACHVS